MSITPLSPHKVVYIQSDQILITQEQDILDLIGETEFQDIVLHDHNFRPDFFDLSTQLLGNVLQKLTNYQVRLAVIGDFGSYPSKILPGFIHESNRRKNSLFVSSLEEVKKIWEI